MIYATWRTLRQAVAICLTGSRRTPTTRKISQMLPLTETVGRLVESVDPIDVIERAHRATALQWLASTDDIFRRVKPATPYWHLVCYTPLIDPDSEQSLMVDHIQAGLWLPPGGHVEPNEHPVHAAQREVHEEVGLEVQLDPDALRPDFITITKTRELASSHYDVCLWFSLMVQCDAALTIDGREFTRMKWWPDQEVAEMDSSRLDPHYHRFLSKRRAHR